jgi:DNA-binding beta-propeller fold protein YncE
MNILMRPFPALAALLASVTVAFAAIEALPVASDLREPFSIAFDAKGDAYGVEFQPSNRVFKWHDGKTEYVSGVKWDSAAKGKQPPEPAKRLDLAPAVYDGMHDIAIAPDGSIYVADTFQHRIVRLDPKTHAATLFAGSGKAGFSGDGGPADQAQFNTPICASIDPTGKALVVTDLGNQRVRRIDLATRTISTLAGNGQKGLPKDGADALNAPMGDARAACVAQDGTLFVLLRGGNSLVAVKGGKVSVVVNKAGKAGPATDGPAAEATMRGPKYVTMDAKGGVLILDTENHCLRRFDPADRTIRTIVGNGKKGATVGQDWGSTQLNRPHGARIGPDGRLYVADSENNRILVGPAP